MSVINGMVVGGGAEVKRAYGSIDVYSQNAINTYWAPIETTNLSFRPSFVIARGAYGDTIGQYLFDYNDGTILGQSFTGGLATNQNAVTAYATYGFTYSTIGTEMPFSGYNRSYDTGFKIYVRVVHATTNFTWVAVGI